MDRGTGEHLKAGEHSPVQPPRAQTADDLDRSFPTGSKLRNIAQAGVVWSCAHRLAFWLMRGSRLRRERARGCAPNSVPLVAELAHPGIIR